MKENIIMAKRKNKFEFTISASIFGESILVGFNERTKNIILDKKLLAASVEGDITRMTALIQAGANPDAHTYNVLDGSISIVDCAARSYEFEAVKLLIENKAATNNEYRGRNDNPLIQAVIAENSEAVKYLLEAKIDPNCKVTNTPLHKASCSGYTGIVKILLEHKANPFQSLNSLIKFRESFELSQKNGSVIAAILQESMDNYEIKDIVVEHAGQIANSEPS
jgi:ankyrin repeat protein